MDKRVYGNSYGPKFKSCLMILFAFFLSAFFIKSYALVFNIVSNGPLPTLIEPGETLPASYIIQNNTLSQRNNNFIKYLPPNVALAGGSCGHNFNLAPHGKAGDSCILNLIVSGPVSGNDPDPHHHLFVCFPGGLTCAGTRFPLNVSQLISISITPTNAFIPTGGTQQYKAVGHFSNGATRDLTRSVIWHSSQPNFATINAFGLAQGITLGQTNITATFGSITSNTAVLSVTGSQPGAPFLWVTTGNMPPVPVDQINKVRVCPVHSDGSITVCHDTNPENSFFNPISIDFLDGTVAYVVNGSRTNGFVSICPLQDVFFRTCSQANTGNLFFPQSINLNPSNTFAYIGRIFMNNPNTLATTVRACRVGANGALSSCFNTGLNTSNQPAFFEPAGTVFTNSGTEAFVLNQNAPFVSHCLVNTTTGALTGCTDAHVTLIEGFPNSITLNSFGTRAWITQGENANAPVVTCQVSGSEFINCVAAITASSSSFLNPFGIAVNVDGDKAYITDNNANALFLCPINPDGTFSSCTPQSVTPTLTNAQGIFINF